MTTRNVLVVGATGKQGAAVVDALLGMPPSTPPIQILALTRHVDSAAAQALEAKRPEQIRLVKGDLNDLDPSLTFATNTPIASMFLMTMPGKEDIVGKTWVNTAIDNGVEQIVLSTVDRGGDSKSWDNPTDVPHFHQKHEIELHLRAKAEALEKTGRHLAWTILRPTAFLDNLNPGTFGKVFAAMWSTSPPAMKLQFISTRDLGVFAAKAIVDPKGWDRRAISLAGEDMTYPEARQTFQRVVGQELPQTWTFLGQGMRWAIGDVGKMFRFFETQGYGCDIAALREEEPSLQSFETWLRESSGWAKEIK